MARILVVGCGDLGAEVIRLLANNGHELIGVRISEKKLPNHIHTIQADINDTCSLEVLETLNPNVVIYCISANAQTDQSYQSFYVDGLRNVLNTQQSNQLLKHVFFISSTRVYGQSADGFLNESIQALPNDFGGKRLLEAESLLKTLPCNATSIRLSGIYGPGRLYLINMAKDKTRWPETNKWTNRIHRDDAAAFVTFLCEKLNKGESIYDCYIGTDNMPTLQYDVLGWIANRLNIETPVNQNSLLIEGKRLSNQRLQQTGFKLTYPTYQEGYSEILNGLSK